MNAPIKFTDEPLTKRLKSDTTSDHDSVDTLVMAARPFEDTGRYAHFLRLQHCFHGAINDLYFDARLNSLLPGLNSLPRFEAVIADLEDLGQNIPAKPEAITPANEHEALGWLYCAEGSNLGAAFLFKETQKLGLDGERGARHLAAHPDGRAPHWREFVAMLNGLELSDEQCDAAVKGATNAFDFYRNALHKEFH